MPIDRKLVHALAEEQLDAIDEQVPDAEITMVCVIAEVVRPSGEVSVRVRSGQSPHAVIGLLRAAEFALLNNSRKIQAYAPASDDAS